MRDLQQQPTPTPESIWAILQENALQLDNFRTLLQENERKYEQRMAENERERKEKEEAYERSMKEMNKKLEGYGLSQGSFAEDYFFNSFYAGKKDFFGEKYKRIDRNLQPARNELMDEYDIVLYGKDSIAIIETKFKARKDDIEQVLRKAETFKFFYPHFKDFKIYLGFAALTFPAHIQQMCIKEGIAIIKQVGEMVIINDTHLKAF